jgi:hypothetical protein
MSTNTLSRRAILAGAASVPALALPAVVAVAATPAIEPAAPDPIFAAIDEHRRLDDKQYEMWCAFQETANEPLERDHARVSAAAHEAAWALTKIRPTTAAGATALFTYVCDDVAGLEGGEEWALPAIANATIGAKVAAHADAVLFDLGEKILTTATDVCRAHWPHNQAEEAMIAWRKKNPAPNGTKALAKWKGREATAKRECGLDTAEAKWDAACSELSDLREEIADFVVSTSDGLEIKKSIVASYEDSRIVSIDSLEHDIVVSMQRDLKHLRRMKSAA